LICELQILCKGSDFLPKRKYYLSLHKLIKTTIMSINEQQTLKEKRYAEAIHYMDNAKDALKKAGKEDNFYSSKKYVRSACGIAYCGVLVALDTYLELKDVEMPKKKRRSISFYTQSIAELDKKMLRYLNSIYDNLHLSGYYDGILDARIIAAGFEDAYLVIDKIKPATV
jgi:predicted HAD superfamily phosphohydrolase